MRVGLNATCFNDRPSGARQRFEGIYGALIRRRPDVEFVIYEPEDCRVADWFADARNVRAVRTPLPSVGRLTRAVLGMSYWPVRLRRDRLDLFEMFHLPLFRAPNCPTVQTIHDVRDIASHVPLLHRTASRAVISSALRKADAVVTVSNTMKAELLALEPRAEVFTIYNGIQPGAFRELEGSALPDPSLPHDYLLAVGHLEERKNYRRLLDALVILRRQRPDLCLMIVGNEGGQLASLRHAVEQRNLGGAVRLMQNVSSDRLTRIYRQSRLVVFPSLYEGFGIPILEAMASCRPLVLSDLPVFVELTQARGIYFSPQDPAEMAEKIAAVLSDRELRAAVVSYGQKRVRDFKFDALAAQVEQLYCQLRPDLLSGPLQ